MASKTYILSAQRPLASSLVGEAAWTLLSFWVQDLRDLDASKKLLGGFFFPPPGIDSISENASLDFQADILNTTSS